MGLAIGTAAALVDPADASLGLVGVARLLMTPWLRVGRGLAGAGVFPWPGVRTLGATVRVRALSPAGAGLLLAGVGLGSLAGIAILSPVVAGRWRRVGPGPARAADAPASPGPVGVGGVLGRRALHAR